MATSFSKRLLCAAVAILLLAVLCPMGVALAAETTDTAAEIACYLHGDVDADGAITPEDAKYILYHTFFPEEYVLTQDADFDNEDGLVTRKDAIYLLFASNEALFGEDYPLEGTVHSYYEPIWSWHETDPSQVTFQIQCGCGEVISSEINTTVTVAAGTPVKGTCVKTGTQEYTATAVVKDSEGNVILTETGTNVVTLPLERSGHELDGELTCEAGANCKYCDYTAAALGHSYKLTSTTAATCEANAVETYTCETCGGTQEVTLEGTKSHQLINHLDMQVGDTCQYIKTYSCVHCKQIFNGTDVSDTYYNHADYKAQVIQEATCVAEGTKVYICTKCNTQKEGTVSIAVNPEAHNWGTADANGTSTCSLCNATKTVVTADKDGKVDATKLTEESEVQLAEDVAVSMDKETLEKLDGTKEITITVEPATPVLDEKLQAQIGDATIYDFNMTADGEPVTEFGGKVTVSLPYTLQEGDDIDAIDVWYIADDGTVKAMTGTYSNGFVTFTTEHFSYYTVTRLAPAERCERYGHIMVTTEKAATCTADGYKMVLCQRCGETSKDGVDSEIYPATGHNYEVTTAATCTTAGVKTCSNCGIFSTIPATGHDMQEDDSSVEASCEAPGKLVKVCANGCGHETQVETAQLTHKWGMSDDPALNPSATCTDAGYKSQICELCEKTRKVNEQNPLGHDFSNDENDVWTWGTDHITATLTLKCDRADCDGTKELQAVVTIKNASPCLGGSAVYTAKASYNNRNYSTEYTEEGAAGAGHTPGEWTATGTQHSRKCTVCLEVIETAAHSWNEGTVTKEPTCSTAGTKAVTCTICSYEGTKSIPATGEHSYVNGICSVCGVKDGQCKHELINKKPLDLSAYNLCGDAEIFMVTCDCGEYGIPYAAKLSCNMVEGESVTMTSPSGEPYTLGVSVCEDCGLTLMSGSYAIWDTQACTRSEIAEGQLSVGSQVIAPFKELLFTETHPLDDSTENMTTLTKDEYGICGVEWITRTCCCGEVSNTMFGNACEFEFTSESATGSTGVCSTCGLNLVTKVTTVNDGCNVAETIEYAFILNGKTLATCTNTMSYEFHLYDYANVERLGEDCGDGLIVTESCTVCGDTYRYFTENHVGITTVAEYDLTNEDICMNYAGTTVCACGQVVWATYSSDAMCQWDYESITEENGIMTELMFCRICQATREIVTTFGADKGENCMTSVTFNVTTYDKNGKLLCTLQTKNFTQNHNYGIADVSLQGDSCTDGVAITHICDDCGNTWSDLYIDHITFNVETYDLSSLGLCTDEVVLWGCPCGEMRHLDWHNGCSWEWDSWNDGVETYICTECQGKMTRTSTVKEVIDACHRIDTETLTFSKGDAEPVVITCDTSTTTHEGTHVLTLNPGATDCTGGFTNTFTCDVCGYTDTYEEHAPEHYTYPVQRERLGEGQICGELTLVTYSCACGQESHAETEWTDGCYYEDGQYYEEYDVHGSTCTKCGVTRFNRYEESRVPGTTCQVHEIETVTFRKDGEELFSYERSNTYNRHTSTYTFQLLGSTCDDGYKVTESCILCNYVWEAPETYYGCEDYYWVTQREVIGSSSDICGDIYLVHRGCACGTNTDVQVETSCQMTYVDGNQRVCQDCGLMVYANSYSEHIDGTCTANRTFDYNFVLDGSIATENRTFVVTDHEYEYTYILEGDTCEDGYRPSATCAVCGHSVVYDWLDYGHNQVIEETWDFSDWGSQCGSILIIDRCPCGQVARAYFDRENCTFELTNEYESGDANEGFREFEWTCSTCGLIRTEATSWTQADTPCTWDATVNMTFTLGSNSKTFISTTMYENHQYDSDKETVALLPGSVTCEDGIIITRYCTVCQETFTGRSSYHRTALAESIDLAQYGAICGSALNVYSCACGEETEARMSGDSQCDLSYQSTPIWIPDVLEGQCPTTSGYCHYGSNAYLRYCAVTDPEACGLKTRYANYDVNEDCTAVYYEVWQLGYDEATGTCQREVKVSRDDSLPYHPYEVTTNRTDNADGSYAEETLYTCPDCGSTYSETYSYDANGNQTRYETVANDTNPGHTKQRTHVVEYGYVHGNYNYRTLERYDTTYADGSTYWNQYEYSDYNFTGSCTCTVAYTSVYGDDWTETQSAHYSSYRNSEYVNATCTQFGKHKSWDTCDVCGDKWDFYEYDTEPTGHNWLWDSSKQTYVCQVCSLENINGASGSIYMEDLTDYDTGSEYIIGYWNRGEILFNPTISVILEDSTAEDNELLVTFSDFTYLTAETDGVTALSFNRADVQSAVDAALANAGYKGSYAIRISFVPVNGDSTLDYAITFDSQTAV